MVADEPRHNFLAGRQGRDHRRYVIVIAIGLVDETTAIGQDADDSGLAAIDNVRVEAFSAVAIGHDGNRAPRYRGGKTAIELASCRFAEPSAVTRNRFRRKCPISAAGRYAGKQLAPSLHVMRESARGKHDTSPRANRHRSIGRFHQRAAHRTLVGEKARSSRRYPELHTEIVGGLHEARDQRCAVDEPHAPTKNSKVEDVPRDAAARIDECGHRTRGVHEVVQIGTCHDAHAEQRRLVLLPAGFPEQSGTEATTVERFRRHRSSSGARARRVAVNVGNAGAAHKLEIRVRLKKVHHPWCSIEERLDSCRIVVVPQLVLQVAVRKLRLFDDAIGMGQWIARHPHPPARPGSSASTDQVLFDHDNFQPVPCSRDRSGKSRGTRANDEEVAIDLACPRLGWILRHDR